MKAMIAAGVRVEMALTSPPYDELRIYPNAPLFTWDVFTEVAFLPSELLVDGGVLVWNVGDSVRDGGETLTSCKQKIHFVEQCGLRVHDTMIYEKVNFGHPERARYHQTFEYVFVFSKGAPRTFNPIKDKPNAWAGTKTFGRNTIREADGTMTERKRNVITDFGMRGNVWRGPTSGQENVCAGSKHPAPMPYWLAFDHVRSWSNPGDTVLDPFHGSGTTGRAAQEQGRNWIGCESNADYLPLQLDRTRQMGGGAMTFLEYIEPHDQAVHDALWEATQRIHAAVDRDAAKAHKEIRAMAVRDRRSIGQLTRMDHFWRRALKSQR